MIPSYIKGGIVDLTKFSPDDYRLGDVATCLSRINRFSGHTHWPYSVAQHAVIVSYLCPPWAAFHGLHHDDHEAFLGDMPGPLKAGCVTDLWYELEDRIDAAIWTALRTPEPGVDAYRAVKNADRWALRLEQINLQGRGEFYDFEPRFEADPDADVEAALDTLELEMTPDEARKLYLWRHWELAKP